MSGVRRLLITDPLHPAVPSAIVGLQSDAAATGSPPWTVIGLTSDLLDRASLVPPPGVTELVAIPEGAAPDWRSQVVTLAVHRRIDAVLPWTDDAARLLAPAATELRELGVALVCPPPALVTLAGDRHETAVRLADHGVPTPPFVPVDHAWELRKAAHELGYPHFPLVARPRRSAGHRGVWSIREDAVLHDASPLPSLPLHAFMAAAATATAPLGLLVQHQVPGIDVHLDILAHDGKVLTSVARTPVRVMGGLRGDSAVGPASPAIITVAEQLVAALRWSQLVNVQLSWDPIAEQGVVCDLSVGVSGSIDAARHVGVPMLTAAAELAITGRPPLRLPAAADRALRFRRYWADQYWDDPVWPV